MFAPRARDACGAFWSRDKMIEALEKNVPHWDYPEYKGEEVALFIPCFIDQFFPEAGVSVVKVLEKLNIPIVYPDEQTCCGQPAFNSGYWDDARKVMERFGRVFEKAEAGGTQYMLVEQDDCNGEDPIECLRRSYQYLRSWGFQ